jgi:uncharacterized protein (DUF4415 family)
MRKKRLTNKLGEVRELQIEDIRAMRSGETALPRPLLDVLPKRKPGERGPQKSPVKQQITLRLDRDVIERFRATGPGWQGRINDVLRKVRSAR